MVYQTKQVKKFRGLATWQLVILLIVVTIVAATLLRMNNVGMSERLDAVIAADKSGDLGMLNERLYDLQEYVFKHMNASTGQFFLEQTYRQRIDQLINDAKNTIGSQSGQNAYKIAAEVCDGKFRGYSQAYAECFLSEVDKHTTTVGEVKEVKMLSPNAFIRSYSSPNWAPDVAGFAVLAWLVLAVVLVTKFIFWAVLKLFIKLK